MNHVLKKGLECDNTQAPSSWWNSLCQVEFTYKQYAIVHCRVNYGKGSARSLFIVKAEDLQPLSASNHLPKITPSWAKVANEKDDLYHMYYRLFERVMELAA